MKVPIVRCWCVPPDKAFIAPGGENPCAWPDCLNGHKPDPQQQKDDHDDGT